MLVSGGSIYVGDSAITYVYQGDDLIWPIVPPTPVSGDYLTFEIISGGTINWYLTGDRGVTKTISYSKNNGVTWNDITATTGGTSFNVNRGERIIFKGTNSDYFCSGYTACFSGSTAYFNLSGNLLSLIYGDEFEQYTEITERYTFRCLFQSTNVVSTASLSLPENVMGGCYYYMFENCVHLTSAPVLPATTLAASCYENMFGDCTSLTTAPVLPATTLARNCYLEMFQYTGISQAPSLPATTLADGCYQGMFRACHNLTSAPDLPASTLGTLSYSYMFMDCENLNYVKCLATDISAYYATSDWVNGVASSGTFVKAASMTNWPAGDSGIPSGWTIINE